MSKETITLLKDDAFNLAKSHNQLLQAAKDVLQTGIPTDHEQGCKCIICLNHFVLVETVKEADAFLASMQ